jgi:uncharacterized protein
MESNPKGTNVDNRNPTVVHFEIPADDIDRARKFYTALFGWKIEKSVVKKDGSSMDYWMISTSESSDKKSTIGGGMMKRQDPRQPNLNYIGVESIENYSRKVTELGGKVMMPKTEISGYGYFAVCMDTENNAFALWEQIGGVQS